MGVLELNMAWHDGVLGAKIVKYFGRPFLMTIHFFISLVHSLDASSFTFNQMLKNYTKNLNDIDKYKLLI